MSITSVLSRRRPAGDRAEVGQPRLLVAVEDAGVEREALAQLGDEGAGVLGVPDRAGRDREDPLGLERLVGLDVLADGAADILDRLGGELARRVDAAPEPGHGRAPLQLLTSPSSTSATKSRVEFVPMSTTATLTGGAA